MAQTIVVLKFGSSVLLDRTSLPAAVHDIYRAVRAGQNVIAVVSAIGRHTDLLSDEAQHFGDPNACELAFATLLATGEQQAAALLNLAVHRAGIPCQLLDTEALRLILHGERLDADPYALNRGAIATAFNNAPVAIVPGFIGRHESGGVALMGRGGSDLTAVFISEQTAAKSCRLVKDVDGIFEHDPADITIDEAPRLFAEVTYDEALRVANDLVQPKAIEYLKCTRRTAEVASLLHDRGTVVGAPASRLACQATRPPLKVVMVGLGTVGVGVYQHLLSLPLRFELVGIAVLNSEKARDVQSDLIADSVDELFEKDFSVLVDVSGDTSRAYGWIERCLQSGRSAVTADKRLVAAHGGFIADTARRYGAVFKYCAAVGGAAPMLEILADAAAHGKIKEIRGVLNATCNFVLDRMLSGTSQDEAVKQAKVLGYAEADPSRDLSGADSADKLRILARTAWGDDAAAAAISYEGIENLTHEQLYHAEKKNHRVRLVASMTANAQAVVRPESLSLDDPLARASGNGNVLQIASADGAQQTVVGQGAGRWPTAEAVMADLIDFINSHAERPRPVVDPQLLLRRPALPGL